MLEGKLSRRGLIYAPLALPTALAVLFTVMFHDPTYRFPMLVLLLPLFLRKAAAVLGVGKSTVGESKVGLVFSFLGFTGFVLGWLLVFALVIFTVAVGIFSLPGEEVLEASALLAGLGFVVVAWFWWPWYARDVLANWPDTGVRIWTSSSNRWERLFLAWRMREMAASQRLRTKGFAGVALTVVVVFSSVAVGVVDDVWARAMEVAMVAALPVLHLAIVSDTNALCVHWEERKPRTD